MMVEIVAALLSRKLSARRYASCTDANSKTAAYPALKCFSMLQCECKDPAYQSDNKCPGSCGQSNYKGDGNCDDENK